MTWLHISDIHFGSDTGTDKEEGKSCIMREHFLAYLKTVKFSIHEIFITGDLGFGPDVEKLKTKADKQKLAKQSAIFIRMIAKQLGISDLKAHVHIIPGNHDLTRSPRRKIYIKGVISDYKDKSDDEKGYFRIESQIIKDLSEQFDFFYMVLEELYGKDEMKKIKREMSENIHRWVSLQSAKLNLLCLNTAILSGLGKEGTRDLELHELLIDSNRIEELLLKIKKKNDNPTIILGHHNDYYFTYEEKNNFFDCCQRNNVKLILCGHAHNPSFVQQDNPRQVVSGCLFDKNKSEVASFYIGNYVQESQKVKLTRYVWESNIWTRDNTYRVGPVLLKADPCEEDGGADDNNLSTIKAFDERKRHLSLTQAKNKYVNHLKKRTADDALKYLRQGVTNESEEFGLTSHLFFEYFYIKPRREEDDRIFDMVNSLFIDESHNMMCIKSTAGTGKTTLIRTLECRINRSKNRYQFQYHVLDCLNNGGATYLFPYNDIRKRFRKEFTQVYQNEDLRCKFFSVLNTIATFNSSKIDSLDWLADEIGAFNRRLYSGKNKKQGPIIENYVQRLSIAFEKIPAKRKESLSLILLILILACKKSCMADGKKIKDIIVIDNIETYTSSVATEVGNNIYNAIKTAEDCFNVLIENKVLHLSFKKDFIFIFCVRPVTNFSLSSRQDYGEMFGANDKYVYTWEYFDFALEAMLKKLKFLEENNINNGLSLSVRQIIKIVAPEKVINDYIDNGKLTTLEFPDVCDFSQRRLLPFFNNNYKNALMNIVSLNKDWLEMALKYSNDSDFDLVKKEARNMAHMILFKHIFDKFISDGTFKAFGIERIVNGGQRHSLIRTVLACIYWKTEGAGSSGVLQRSVTVRELLDAFPTVKANEIIDILCKFSIYMKNKDDEIKSNAIKYWGELIELKGIKNALTVKRDISDADMQNSIEITLSSIGKCFVEFVSVQFEFFSARILNVNRNPLSLYDNPCLETNNNGFSHIIDEVIEALNKFAETLQETVKEYVCKDCLIMNQKKKNFGGCMAIILRQELYLAIQENINYIDRFRRVYFIRFKDINANEILLEKIKKINSFYDIAKKTIEHPMTSCDSYYHSRFNNPYYRYEISTKEFDDYVDLILDKMKKEPSCINIELYKLLEMCMFKQGVFGV